MAIEGRSYSKGKDDSRDEGVFGEGGGGERTAV